ncbi:hypothetical protein EB093_08720 [bacterium]|nr:hypothetical protein [bacterium]
MAGFRSKRLMQEVKWLGPYEPETRHADPVTIDHIIELRKQLREMEKQRDNAVSQCTQLNRLVWNLREQLMFGLDWKPDDDERNC